MTEKRLIIRDGDYAWVDTVTDTVIEVEDAFDLVNELHKENDYLTRLVKAYQKSVEDYKYQIRKAVDEKLSMLELADNCGVDVE